MKFAVTVTLKKDVLDPQGKVVGQTLKNMGIKNLNQYFKDYKTKQFQKISLVSKLNESIAIPYCPIIFGTNFIDQCNVLEELIDIEVKNIAYPLLFLPFASRASEIIGKRIFLEIDEKEYLLNFNQTILSNHLNV